MWRVVNDDFMWLKQIFAPLVIINLTEQARNINM